MKIIDSLSTAISTDKETLKTSGGFNDWWDALFRMRP
jgi:hypothetical protein